MFGLLSNINLTAKSIVSLRGMLANKLHISKDIKNRFSKCYLKKH